MAYAMNPVTLKRNMVEEWTDERSLGHGWFVLLKEGWTFDPLDDLREQSYETKREALDAQVYCVRCLDALEWVVAVDPDPCPVCGR